MRFAHERRLSYDDRSVSLVPELDHPDGKVGWGGDWHPIDRSFHRTGHFFIDEHVLRDAGVTQFDQYAVCLGEALMPDSFVGTPT